MCLARALITDLTEMRSGVARQGRPVARAAVRRASLDDVEAAMDTGAPEDTGADMGRSAVGTAYLSFGDLRGRE